MKRIFLYSLITSVALCALLGIVVIIAGDFGQFEAKVLLTTLTVTCASILGLACGPAYEAGIRRAVPLMGIIFALISGVLWIILIWREDHTVFVGFERTVMTVTLLAAAFSHVSLVSLARLDKKFQWSFYAIHIAVATLTGTVLALIWLTDQVESDLTFRFLGVTAIIVSALTILIPVFHRLSNSEPDIEKIDAEIEKLRSRIAELEEQRATAAGGGTGG